MKALIQLIVFATFSVVSITGHTSDPAPVQACKKIVMGHFKLSHKYWKDCHANIKDESASDEEIFNKMGCSVKCILKKEGLLDDNDMTSEDILKNAVKDRVTPDYADKLTAKFLACKTKHGDKLDKSDALCKSYQDFGLCTQEAVSHVCYE